MAIASVLAIGTGAGTSGEIVVANGATLAVCLMKTGGGIPNPRSVINILKKDSNAQLTQIGKLNTSNPSYVLTEGTYKFTRVANGASVGVFSG